MTGPVASKPTANMIPQEKNELPPEASGNAQSPQQIDIDQQRVEELAHTLWSISNFEADNFPKDKCVVAAEDRVKETKISPNQLLNAYPSYIKKVAQQHTPGCRKFSCDSPRRRAQEAQKSTGGIYAAFQNKKQ